MDVYRWWEYKFWSQFDKKSYKSRDKQLLCQRWKIFMVPRTKIVKRFESINNINSTWHINFINDIEVLDFWQCLYFCQDMQEKEEKQKTKRKKYFDF